MGWIEYLLTVEGSSLEIFVAMECQGSLLQKVNKKQLTAICFIVAVCQLLATVSYTHLCEQPAAAWNQHGRRIRQGRISYSYICLLYTSIWGIASVPGVIMGCIASVLRFDINLNITGQSCLR